LLESKIVGGSIPPCALAPYVYGRPTEALTNTCRFRSAEWNQDEVSLLLSCY